MERMTLPGPPSVQSGTGSEEQETRETGFISWGLPCGGSGETQGPSVRAASALPWKSLMCNPWKKNITADGENADNTSFVMFNNHLKVNLTLV